MRNHHLSLSSVANLLGVTLVLGLTGCSANFGDLSNASTQTAMHIRGVVHGGQQALNGAHIYMYAASTGGYGGNGIAASSSNASTSLLTSATGNPADGNGNFYVVTDAAGNFDINGAYACTPNTQIYLYSIGGDPQINGTPSGANSAATLMAVVGNCASATPSGAFPGVTFVSLNEVSTAVAAFALAGFATDPLHIGAPSAVTGHAASGTGIANAFNTALNIVNQATGLPNATFPNNSKVTVPVTRINTVADFLAACVNSSGAGSTGCSTLFTNTTYATAPTDTATAAINFAQNSNGNVAALIGLITNTSPFQPFFSSANDLALTLNYSGGGLNEPFGIAIDGAGNAWLANFASNAVTEISSTGTFLSGASGYTGGGLDTSTGVAIDNSGNAWVTNQLASSVTEISSTGAFLSGTTGYTGGGLEQPVGIAIDAAGNAWAVNDAHNSVTEFSSTGAVLSGASGYIGGGLNEPNAIAIDGSGNAWLSSEANSTANEFTSAGTALTEIIGYTGGGLSSPHGIAIDSSGNAWLADYGGNRVSEFSNAGAPLSGVAGYIAGSMNGPAGIAIDGAGNAWMPNYRANTVTKLSSAGTILSGTGFYTGGGLNEPDGIAIDSSGNVWTTNQAGSSVTELVGVATPVITPIVAGLPVVPTPDGSSNLGTRP